MALLLGGWFLYDRAGGVEVSPAVLIGVAVFAALFFGLVVVKALAIRHVPPAQLRPIVGADGVALNSIGPNGGLVRVSAEEWQAVTAGERDPRGEPCPRVVHRRARAHRRGDHRRARTGRAAGAGLGRR